MYFLAMSQSRFRTCSSSSCPGGSFSESRPCTVVYDPVPVPQPQWAEWGAWSECRYVSKEITDKRTDRRTDTDRQTDGRVDRQTLMVSEDVLHYWFTLWYKVQETFGQSSCIGRTPSPLILRFFLLRLAYYLFQNYPFEIVNSMSKPLKESHILDWNCQPMWRTFRNDSCMGHMHEIV